MGKKIAVVILLAVFAVSSFLPSTAMAYGKEKDKACHGKKGLDEKILWKAHFFLRNSDDLELSDEQVKQIKDLKFAVKKELVVQNADIEVLGIDIKSKLYSSEIDTEAISKLIDQKYDLKKAKAKYLVGKYAELKGILTAEQKEKLRDLWKQCKKK